MDTITQSGQQEISSSRALPPARLWLLVFVLLIGLAYTLQVHALDRQDLWGDEAVSALVLKNNAIQILEGKVDPFHPPLYFLLLRAWTQTAGGSEFAIRYLSLMGMLIAVAFIGRAALEARDHPTAGLSLLLAAVAPMFIYYAQEARMYGVALAFNAGALWAATAALRRANLPGQRGFWRAWIVFTFLALGTVYAHYLSFLHLLGIALGLLLAWRRRPRMLAIAAGTAIAMGLAYLPWAAWQMNRTRGQFPFRPEVWTPSELGHILQDTLQAFSVGQTLYDNWAWIVVVLMATLAALGWITALRARRSEQWLPGLIVIAILVVGWGFNAYLFAFEPRYLMMGMPAYLLLIAFGLRWITKLEHRRIGLVLTGLALIVIIAAASAGNHTYYTRYRKGNYGQLMRNVAANAKPSDILILNNPLQRAIFDYYQPAGIDYHFMPPDDIIDPIRLNAAMTQLLAEHRRAWLVMFGNPAEYDPQFRVENWLATHGAKSYYEGFGDSTLSLYVMAAPAGTSVPVSIIFGDQIALLGYRLSANTVQPRDTLVVELDWQAIASPDKDYTVFVQLLAPDGTLLAQVDTPPVGGTRPTHTWDNEIVSDRYALLVPDNAPTGEAQLIVGLYPWPDLTRLPVTDAGGLPLTNDAVNLARIAITR